MLHYVPPACPRPERGPQYVTRVCRSLSFRHNPFVSVTPAHAAWHLEETGSNLPALPQTKPGQPEGVPLLPCWGVLGFPLPSFRPFGLPRHHTLLVEQYKQRHLLTTQQHTLYTKTL